MSSIQLVLSNYLSGLRERNELDSLLPDLLREMGHSVLSRPQIGTNQAGADVVSTKKDESGVKEVFLYVIKFGDLGREDFYGGQQAIDPSVREVCNDFIRNRLPQALKSRRKRIVLVTNGVLKQEAQSAFAALSHEVAERPQCSLEFWGIDALAPLIEQYLFNEMLLLSTGKSDLRAALAGLEESGTAIHRFIRFISSCFPELSIDETRSKAVRKKRFLKDCAAASMGLAVLQIWGKNEGNLKPGVVAGEYLMLRMWAEAVKSGFFGDKTFVKRLEGITALQVKALLEYFEKVMPQLQNKRAVLSYRPDRIFYADLVFDELGRLSILLLLLQHFSESSEIRSKLHRWLLFLLSEHSGCHLPVYDGQSIDLTLVLTALISEGDWGNAQSLLSDVTGRLDIALKSDSRLPVDTDLPEDAIAINIKRDVEPREFFEVSTLIPALATIAAGLKDEKTLKVLREDILPLAHGVTLERWFPSASLETLTGSKSSVAVVGVSRAIAGIQSSSQEEMEASLRPIKGGAEPEDFKWHGTPWEILIALSARIHRHPLPTWFVAKYTKMVV